MSEIIQYTLPQHLAARQAARRREWSIQLIAISLAVLTFAGAGLLVTPINRIRKERQLVTNPEALGTLPPDIALVGKLGTFRALAIDWAFIRAERLKEEGKNYEALELHKTICALAPRFPKVWSYAAWNMAYNISVGQFTPEARWKWVKNGIEILRDKGIQYNPRSVTLYKELAWIYWHKIGDYLDDQHMNYKRALAVEMERVLGPPPITTSDEEYFAWFKKIVDAPRNLRQFLEQDKDVAELVDRLREVKLRPDLSLLEFVARNIRPELRAESLVEEEEDRDSLHARRLALVRNPDFAEPLDRLLAAVRSKVLREDLKFNLEYMYKLMADEYGPLDWRNAFAHSLYWSSYGDETCKGQAGVDAADAMNTARFVFFSLNNLINRGRITLYPNFDDSFSSYIEMSPDLRFIPYLYNTYMRLGKEQFKDDPRYVEGTPGPQYMTGFVTAMHNWIQLLYLEGGKKNLEMAENFYAWLREHNPNPDGSTQQRYLKTLDEFVMDDVLDQLQTYRAATAIIRSFVQRALKQYALGQTESGLNSIVLARKCYDFWMIDTKRDINDRRKLQPPKIIFRDEIYAFMQERSVDPLFKARLWKQLPKGFRQMTWDRLASYFQDLCAAQEPAWSVRVAFPEPEGMDEFRQEGLDIKYRSPARRKDADVGEQYKE